MITQRALEYEAHRMGIVVSDQDVIDALRGIPSFFQDGKFVGKEAYAAMLAQQGMSIDDFEADIRRQIMIETLRKVALEATLVTPAEIEQEFHKKNDQVVVQYVKITQDKYKKEAEPTTEEMQQYFKLNTARYQEPEAKNLVVLVADGDKLQQSLNPTDSDLQMAYNQNQANYRLPERLNERHILLMTQGKPASEDAKIKAKADDLVKQLRAGADFAEMAKKYSEDPGSASKGGEYDNVVRGQMAAEFEKASFSLKPMAISDPVKTQYGYHIIQVLTHEDARIKPFAEVKDELAKQWKQQRVTDAMQKISEKVQAAWQADPTHPEKVAADFGMQLVRADNVAPGATVPEVGTSSDFDQAIAALKTGEISQAVNPSPNKVAIAQVTAVIPPHPMTFDQAKSQIHDSMVNTKLAGLVQKNSKELVESAKANGGDLAKAAKALGLEAKTTAPFKQQAQVDGLGSANYVTDAFKDPAGTIMAPVPTPEATVVVKVVQHIDADVSQLPAQRDSIRDTIKTERVRDRNTMFEAGVVDQLVKEGVIKMHPEVVTRIVASFRGGS